MDRSRSAALPLPAVLDDVPDLGHPTGMPLSERLETLRSVRVTRDDVTSFVEELALPLVAGETPRHRADLLLDVLEDEQLSGLVTHEGFAVGPAALEALQALGFPYALEVTPEMLVHAHRDAPTGSLMPGTAWGVTLALLSALFATSKELDTWACVLLVAPALATALCRELGWSLLHRLSSCLQWSVTGPLVLATGISLLSVGVTSECCLLLGFTLMLLQSARCLHRGPSEKS